MRISKIFVGEYRKLKDTLVTINDQIEEAFLQDVYGRLGISLFAGPNGSGKTALLSFVAQVFHRLEREPEQLPTEFILEYSLEVAKGTNVVCSLSKSLDHKGIALTVDGVAQGIIRKNLRGVPVQKSGDLNYDDISHYLPANIIISAFSLHGEYPHPRMSNWIGDRRIDIYDTKNLYGNNHYSFPSFSHSINKLLQLIQSKNGAINTLESLIGGKFTGMARVMERGWGKALGWVEFSDEVARAEENEEIYINDFEIDTESGKLTLGNMSSGQKMLFVRLLSILGNIQDNSIVIIEEPEIHLDSNWSHQLISVLLGFFSTYNAHLLVATHSFSLLNSVPSKWLFFADQGQFVNPSNPTLLANEAWITNSIFSPKPHAVERQVLKYSGRATKKQLEKILRELGESSTKYAVFQRLLTKLK